MHVATQGHNTTSPSRTIKMSVDDSLSLQSICFIGNVLRTFYIFFRHKSKLTLHIILLQLVASYNTKMMIPIFQIECQYLKLNWSVSNGIAVFKIEFQPFNNTLFYNFNNTCFHQPLFDYIFSQDVTCNIQDPI